MGAMSSLLLALLALLGAPSGDDALLIQGQGLTLGFSAQTGGLRTVQGPGPAHPFIRNAAEAPLLWRLVLKDGHGDRAITMDNTKAGPPAVTREAGKLTMAWKDVALPKDAGTLDVRVECTLPEKSDAAELRLYATSNCADRGLWEVQFPVIAPVCEKGSADVAVGRGTWGALYEKAEEEISGEYPSGNFPMQLMLVQEGGNGLYLAAQDAAAMFKEFELYPGGEFHVSTRAVDMGVPGNRYEAPYPFVLAAYRGGWMDGCKRYRAWAVKDAPWTRKGPLAQRTDVPEGIKHVCAWLLGGGSAAEAVPQIGQFAGAVGAPVGVHWYNWHEIPFDTHYPDYFPTKPGFAEGVAALKKEGIVVMPYINARLWDTGNEDFAAAKPASTKDEDGDVTIEEYGSGAKLAVMCPTQALWQKKVEEIIHRLGEECGVNAVYMDQIASAPPRVCFDKAHGHALGSGDWWVSGYRTLLTPIKEWCAEPSRSIGLTTENDAECYMDNVDGLLIWTPRSENDIPMNMAVYSGYTLYFASNRAFAFGDEGYCLCQARDFTWGAQLGWDGPEILQPQHIDKLMFLSRLARLRAKALNYVVYGELLEVLRPVNEVPKITGKWNTPKGDAPVTLPAAHAALWRGQDGSLAVLMANADKEARQFVFHFDADRVTAVSGESWSATAQSLSEEKPLGAFTGRQFDVAVDLPPRDALILHLHKGK